MSVTRLLACPVCGGGMETEARRLICGQGHSFDLARSGYVNLTGGRPPRRGGDTAEMIDARARFLASGHLEPVAAAVARAATHAPAAGVVELGTGTGYYLDRTARSLGAADALGIDLSKRALALAARQYPGYLFAAADVEESLPVRAGAADVVLSVFAPRPERELKRIVSEGGSLVVAAATERHLLALRDRFGLLGVRPGKLRELQDRLGQELALAESAEVEYPIRLSASEASDAIAMGPSARHGAVAAAPSGRVDDRVSVLVARFARRRR